VHKYDNSSICNSNIRHAGKPDLKLAGSGKKKKKKKEAFTIILLM
jgi:hypothetical protein